MGRADSGVAREREDRGGVRGGPPVRAVDASVLGEPNFCIFIRLSFESFGMPLTKTNRCLKSRIGRVLSNTFFGSRRKIMQKVFVRGLEI